MGGKHSSGTDALFLVVDSLDLGDEVLLSEVLDGGGGDLDGVVLDDGLDAGLVDAHLSPPEDGGLLARPRDQDELGPLGLIVGHEGHLEEAVLHLVLLEVRDTLSNATLALAINLDGRVVRVAEDEPER